MKNIYLIMIILSSCIIFLDCNDSPRVKDKPIKELSNSETDNKIIQVFSGQKVVCENCGKIIKENVDTLNVNKSEAPNYKVIEEMKICKECGEQIPTKREINIFNDFMSEDIKRIKSVSPQKFTVEYDDRTAALLDKKIMNRWKINKSELTRTILKVNMWAVENRFLRESIVIESGLQYALEQREKIIK